MNAAKDQFLLIPFTFENVIVISIRTFTIKHSDCFIVNVLKLKNKQTNKHTNHKHIELHRNESNQ